MVFVLQGRTETGSGAKPGPLCSHPPWGAGTWELLPKQDRLQCQQVMLSQVSSGFQLNPV